MASILEVWIDSLLEEKTCCYGCSSGDLKGETENEIIAGQDQALQTKYHAKILHPETDSKCRL
jgi:hypothetical protein